MCRMQLAWNKDHEKEQSKKQDPKYLEKLEKEKTIALDFIRNNPPLSFDEYNEKFLTGMSIALHSNIQKKHLLVLRLKFVAHEYTIELKPQNNNDKNRRYVVASQNDDCMDGGGINLPDNKLVKFEIKHLEQECDYFILRYKLNRRAQNSAKSAFGQLRNLKTQDKKKSEQRILTTLNPKSRPSYDEETYEIPFMKAKQDVFPEDLKCWHPVTNIVDKMELQAKQDQKEHEYFIMACVHAKPEEYVRSKQVREIMDLFRKQDEEKPSS